MQRAPTWTVVATYPAVFQAEMAAETLKQAGIPAVVRAESSGIFGAGYAGTVTGGARVLVPADLVDEARDVLDLDTDPGGPAAA
ncbi:MAG: DUF2007 domain-containing protein [Gemmatimonadota bacterium]|jgi:hypothetical protein